MILGGVFFRSWTQSRALSDGSTSSLTSQRLNTRTISNCTPLLRTMRPAFRSTSRSRSLTTRWQTLICSSGWPLILICRMRSRMRSSRWLAMRSRPSLWASRPTWAHWWCQWRRHRALRSPIPSASTAPAATRCSRRWATPLDTSRAVSCIQTRVIAALLLRTASGLSANVSEPNPSFLLKFRICSINYTRSKLLTVLKLLLMILHAFLLYDFKHTGTLYYSYDVLADIFSKLYRNRVQYAQYFRSATASRSTVQQLSAASVHRTDGQSRDRELQLRVLCSGEAIWAHQLTAQHTALLHFE